MSSQDAIVEAYTLYATTEADVLTAQILAYHRGLSEPLFDLSLLDDAHKLTIRDLSKQNLVRLRQRLELLVSTVRLATQAPDI